MAECGGTYQPKAITQRLLKMIIPNKKKQRQSLYFLVHPLAKAASLVLAFLFLHKSPTNLSILWQKFSEKLN